jgi:ribonuclease J
VDCGIAFDNQGKGDARVLLPDPSYIEKRRAGLQGLVITHAHEDHIGAVVQLWPRLRCPVYATPFAASYLHKRIAEFPDAADMPIRRVHRGDTFSLGSFSVTMVPVTHSIPEACMLEIETPAGRIVHTGDWKIDHAPLLGPPIDPEIFRKIGDKGVLAAVTDSTNSPTPGSSGDEEAVCEGLTRLFARLKNRIIVTCIARNTSRIQSIAEAAYANGRQVGLVGRSLWTFDHIARDLGFFNDFPPFLGPRKANKLPPIETVLIVTGSQGESNAALSRMANDEHRDVSLERGDHVVFSARVIPDCAEAIADMQKRLRMRGAEVITKETVPEFIYASGHPSREDVLEMYQWLRPQLLVPVHGETRHLEANGEIARQAGIGNVIIPNTGGVLRLGPGEPQLAGRVRTGHLVPEPVRMGERG